VFRGIMNAPIPQQTAIDAECGRLITAQWPVCIHADSQSEFRIENLRASLHDVSFGALPEVVTVARRRGNRSPRDTMKIPGGHNKS